MPNSRPSPRGSAAACPTICRPPKARWPSRSRSACTRSMRSGMKPGDRVLILGAGPIGLLVAFWARRHRRARTSSSPTSTAIRRSGRPRSAPPASRSPDPGSPPSSGDMLRRQPDIVFECVGKRGLIDFACRLVRVHGTVVGVGLCVGGDEWDPFAALSKEIQIVFAVFFTMAEFETALDALGPGRFRPQALITDRIGFGRFPEIFEALRRRTTQCKVLIQPTPADRQLPGGRWMEFETLTFDIDGVRTVVKAIGSGPPCWRCMAPPRSKGYRLGTRSRRPLPRLSAFPPRLRRERCRPAPRRHAGHDRPQSAPRRGARPRPAASRRASPWAAGWPPRWRPSPASASTGWCSTRRPG